MFWGRMVGFEAHRWTFDSGDQIFSFEGHIQEHFKILWLIINSTHLNQSNKQLYIVYIFWLIG